MGEETVCWHNIPVIVINLSQHVSRCDRAPLLGEIGRTPALTRFFRLVSGLPDPGLEAWIPFLIVCTR